MSFVKVNNEIKFLGEELYLYNPNIKQVNNYTNDIKKFVLYNQKDKYEKGFIWRRVEDKLGITTFCACASAFDEEVRTLW